MTKLSELDEAEYKRLEAELGQVERMLATGIGSSFAAGSLQAFASRARQRLGELEEKAEKQEQERTEVESRALAANLAAREVALTKREQELYRHFLEKDHFAKSDFDALESFYSSAYDRLSEGGKDEMSQRVWGGVRAGEYQFIELPEPVKEKEAQRMERFLRKAVVPFPAPEADKADFLRARETGQIQRSYEILNRRSFAEHTALPRQSEHAAEVVIEPSEVLETQKNKTAPAHVPDAAPLGGSIKIELKDPGVDDIALKLKPPLSGAGHPTGPKTPG